MTEAVLGKLEHAFSIGASDREACLYADINPTTLYEYQLEHPEFAERKESLKQSPLFKARVAIESALDRGDTQTARWYAERRDSDFRPKSETDITSKGEKLEGNANVAELAARAAELLKEQKT